MPQLVTLDGNRHHNEVPLRFGGECLRIEREGTVSQDVRQVVRNRSARKKQIAGVVKPALLLIAYRHERAFHPRFFGPIKALTRWLSHRIDDDLMDREVPMLVAIRPELAPDGSL